MTKSEIAKALLALFGYSRSSENIEECISNAIKTAKELDAIALNEDGKYILKEE